METTSQAHVNIDTLCNNIDVLSEQIKMLITATQKQNECLAQLAESVDKLQKKIDKMEKYNKTVERRLFEKTERDINKAIRSYALGAKEFPPSFVPTRIPTSKLFE